MWCELVWYLKISRMFSKFRRQAEDEKCMCVIVSCNSYHIFTHCRRSNVCRLKRRYRRRWRVMWGTFTANMLSPMNQSTMSNSRYVSLCLPFCLYVMRFTSSGDGVSRRDDVWAPVSHYFLWILVWPMRPILDEGSCTVCGLGCRDGLTRRTFPSAALFFCLGDTDVLKVLHPSGASFSPRAVISH